MCMRVSDLERLYDYSYWANRKLFAVVTQLTPEQFTRSVAGSYESIRNTLVHALSAEWGWLERSGGPPRGAKLDPANYATPASLVEGWSRVEGYMREFMSKLDDEKLTRDVEFAIGSGPKQSLPIGDLLQHGVVHGIHHRAQVALLLRVLGYTPGNFDMLFYFGNGHRVPKA